MYVKNSVHLFTALNTGMKIPFALANFTAALPITKDLNGGTKLYGVGIPGGIEILENVEVVTGLYNDWFKTNAAGVAGRA